MSRKVCISETDSCSVEEWRISEGDSVTKGTILCCYKLDETIKELRSPCVGNVARILTQEGTRVPPNETVVEIEPGCDHSVVVFDMCAHCGANLKKIAGQSDERGATACIPLLHTMPELKVSKEEARLIASQDEGRLIQQQKLALIVDLDKTVIHTTIDPSIRPGLKDVYGFHLPGHPDLYHCRLRPGTREFIERLAKKYEMHVVTMAGRHYAHTIANLLDPDGKYFQRRVLSRDELIDPFSKAPSLKAVFPIDDSMVVIIDDREDVWGSRSNLIQVKPYEFFTGVGDINAPPPPPKETADRKRSQNSNSGPPPKKNKDDDDDDDDDDVNEKVDKENGKEEEEVESDSSSHSSLSRDDESSTSHVTTTKSSKEISANEAAVDEAMKALEENDKDRYLIHLQRVLENVHDAFYDEFKRLDDKSRYPDVRTILPRLRATVLKGANLLFSGVIPTNMKQPKQHVAWRTAIALGAKVSSQLELPQRKSRRTSRFVTTHVVANRADTYKAAQARRALGVFLVSVDWLWKCAEQWDWVDEERFPVAGDVPVAVDLDSPLLVRKRKGDDDDDEDDDDKVRRGGRTLTRLLSVQDIEEMDREVDEAMNSESDVEGKCDVVDELSNESGPDSESGNSSEDDMVNLLNAEIAAKESDSDSN